MGARSNSITPAGKLREHLQKAATSPDGATTWHTWATVFGKDPKDPQEVRKVMNRLYETVSTFERMVRMNIPAKETILLKYLHIIREVTTPRNLDARWAAYKSQITDAVLDSLEYAEHELKPFAPSDLEESLGPIEQSLRSVKAQIHASDLPKQVKELLSQRIRDLLAAFDIFRIYGVNDIEKAVSAATGTIVLQGGSIASQPKNMEWLSPFTESLSRLTKWVVVADGSIRLGKAIKAFIGFPE